jgi:hypothetical protein
MKAKKDKRVLSKAAKKRELAGSKAGAAASVGNDWWQKRAKHGRDAMFTDPKLLLEELEGYIKWVENNPLIEIDYRGMKRVEIPRKRPVTLIGFCLYLGVTSSWWRQFKDSETYNANPDFSTVFKFVEDHVHNQQYEGAAAGFFNANIIARSLGLVDRADVTSDNKALPSPTINVMAPGTPFSKSEEDIKD